MLHFKSISELREAIGFPPPEHPQMSLLRDMRSCPLSGQEFTTDCYMISLKRLKSGNMLYGRTPYDHSNGCLNFVKPRQVLKFNNFELEENSFIICIHEDFFHGHILRDQLQGYDFFDYETSEALHLSPSEETVIWEIYGRIEAEYKGNQDDFSRDIILTYLEAIFKYSLRYYRRQFINRIALSGKTISKFNRILSSYIEKSTPANQGLPTVNQIADELNISARYLSNLLKQETGKTAKELIHIVLIAEAKNRIRSGELTISEIAFALGFENRSYFSKLFKRETSLTPLDFKNQLLN